MKLERLAGIRPEGILYAMLRILEFIQNAVRSFIWGDIDNWQIYGELTLEREKKTNVRQRDQLRAFR